MDYMETPLLCPEGRQWKEELAQQALPLQFHQWDRAQQVSVDASRHVDGLEALVNPLPKLTNKENVKKIWDAINAVSRTQTIVLSILTAFVRNTFPMVRWTSIRCGS